MKKVLLFCLLIGCFGWLSNLEFQDAQQSAEYYQQMKDQAIKTQQLKDAGIDPYDY